MKKIIALVLAGILLVGAVPCYAEDIDTSTTSVTRTLAVTPHLKIPEIPKIPKITVKLNFKIDFSKYIPKLY